MLADSKLDVCLVCAEDWRLSAPHGRTGQTETEAEARLITRGSELREGCEFSTLWLKKYDPHSRVGNFRPCQITTQVRRNSAPEIESFQLESGKRVLSHKKSNEG